MGKREYTPFLAPMKTPEIDGVYRNKESGKLLLIKNSWLRGFIECGTDGKKDEPYDAYQGYMHLEGNVPDKKCIIEPHHLVDGYEKIF